MSTVKIDGKNYKIKPTYGRFQKIYEIYDFSKVEEMSLKEANDMFCDCYWMFLKRRWYGLKPFVTKRIFVDNVTMSDLKEMAELMPKLLAGEDRNLGNSD